MKFKKTVFSGFYGFKNTGDDSFLEVCAWGAKKFWNSKENVFLGSKLPRLQNDYKELSDSKFKGHNRLLSFKELLNANAFFSAGGSTFSNHSKFSIKQLAEYSKYFNRKLKTGGIGVSIGPFKSIDEEKNVKSYLKKIDYLAVRDQKSYEIAESFDLPYNPINAFDLAALLPEVYNFKPLPKKNKKIVGVSVCNYESYKGGDIKNEERRNQYIINTLNKLPDDESIVYRFFYFNGHPIIGDKGITDFIISKINKKNIEIIPYLNDVKATWDKIADCSLMFSTRLHASIFACYASVPFFLIEYHRKCTDFLNDIGQDEKYRIFDAVIHEDFLVKQIMDVLINEDYTPPRYKQLTIERSIKNFSNINTF